VHGEAGVGKTALLGHLAAQASDCRVARAAGVQSEMELAFAGLHQLLAPALDLIERLPTPQQEALRTTFGLNPGPVPDRFLVGLAVLGLLSEVAEDRPLLCIVDDEQWLDRASAQMLAFVARRLAAEPVGLVFGARGRSRELEGLPELAVHGLRDRDARALLDSVVPGPMDAAVRDRLVAETRGNPLALVELPRGLTPAELAGGFGLPGVVPLSGTVEDSFRRRSDALPAGTRRLLLVAAAEPVGDPVLLWSAARRLGIDAGAATPAREADLIEFGARVRFRHPLVRSAVYWSAPAEERGEVHGALAQVTDPALDPDRRAWHLAAAALGPDEEIAVELERSAGRAQARGGVAAAAAFLEHAARLTPDPAQRAGRALAAAHAKLQAGAVDTAIDLLAMAEAGPLGDLERAYVDLVRAQLAFVTRRGSDAPPLLVRAAERLATVDAGLSRATYLDALAAAVFAGRLAGPGGSMHDVARAACEAPAPSHTPQPSDLLLDGLAATFSLGYETGLPVLRRALEAFGDDRPAERETGDAEMRWLSLAFGAAMHLWDDERTEKFSRRWAERAREMGALSELPVALLSRVTVPLVCGEQAVAASAVEEMRAAIEATQSTFLPYGPLAVASVRGREADASVLFEAMLRDASLRGEGMGISAAGWANAVLNNGLGRYREAVTAAQLATENSSWELGFANWALPELVEAAARSGMPETAAGAHRRLAGMTDSAATDWALGIEARSRALISEGDVAERLYRSAIVHLGRTRIRMELARAHLLFGEWLRRERRRSEARAQLRTALGMLEAMRMEGFAERARGELRATGETVRKRTVETRDHLTQQEGQIARMARDGLSNPEIGTRLFISARTVEYHLAKVFTKLGISSRTELGRVLTNGAASASAG
jgi:DNA-binding CsgD family transcriptional regulator